MLAQAWVSVRAGHVCLRTAAECVQYTPPFFSQPTLDSKTSLVFGKSATNVVVVALKVLGPTSEWGL